MIDPDLTLLLVEDNDIDVIVVKRLMRRLSIDLPIIRVHDGRAALEMLREPVSPPRVAPPYVIVLDINMPRVSGFEFLEAITGDSQFANTPIFILSTSTNPDDSRKAEQYRVRGYFVKPISETELTTVLSATGTRAA